MTWFGSRSKRGYQSCAHRQFAIATLASSARLPPIGKQPGRRFGAISQMRGVAILAFSHCE
ncbi:hypothetical protein CAI18_16965 [Xanthomonas citri pv. punicae]|nr:hypothetical protein BI314_18830 [Xanthomonas citri pv. citri]KAB0535381.1 hypothetical protein F7R02_10830 [Xanthomonas cissicola]QCZ63988.1 hypothetical protein CAI14_04205 [Xanthomonas citri pv. punicae]QYF43944.1 hypothetical protein HZS93_01230 [Xanthomonas citri]CCF68071.1 putative uncharacterized protein [Xanthomonas citri pv. punicae str. LMG 859]CCG36117.1 putative uncharacterized protein [Xanthomonas citri pv. mangiferaeindicae LMG 941]